MSIVNEGVYNPIERVIKYLTIFINNVNIPLETIMSETIFAFWNDRESHWRYLLSQHPNVDEILSKK